MHSLSATYLGALRFDNLQLATLRKLGEHHGRQQLHVAQSPETLKDLVQAATIESTESSNRLEGVITTRPRLKSLVLHNAAPRSRSEQEIAGYRDALALIHEAAPHMGFTPGVIQQLHARLYSYMPQDGGHWKATNNDIVERHADGSTYIRFQPVQAHLTPMAMEQLCQRYAEAKDQHLSDPLVLVPLAILDFLCIHPFPDGNGRMARLLTLMLLYHLDYSVGRYISLERVFEDSKEGYYASLHASSQHWHEAQHDPKPWLDYFWGALLRAYREFEERVGTIDSMPGGKSDRVRNEVLKRHQPFAISDIEEACVGVSRDTIRMVLRAMKAEGLIEPVGKGRGTRWVRTPEKSNPPV